MLVVDRHRPVLLELCQIQFRNDSMLFRRKSNRSNDDGLFHRFAGYRRIRSAFLIDATVLDAAFDGVRTLDKYSLDLFVEEQAGTIYKFIDHPGRKIVRKLSRFTRRFDAL